MLFSDGRLVEWHSLEMDCRGCEVLDGTNRELVLGWWMMSLWLGDGSWVVDDGMSYGEERMGLMGILVDGMERLGRIGS